MNDGVDRGPRAGRMPAAGPGPGFVVAVSLGLAAWNNLANFSRFFHRWYPAVNLAATAGLVAAGRRAGLTWDDMGLDPGQVRRGLGWGGTVAAVLAAGIGAGLVIPGTRAVLRDGRVADLTGRDVAFQAAVRIPVGTAVWEEVAFRGVLYGAWQRLAGPTPAAVGSSLVFAVWHVTPTWQALRVNSAVSSGLGQRAAERPARQLAAVAAGCAATGLGGLGFCLLRRWTGGILASTISHAASNSLAMLAAAAAHRVRLPGRRLHRARARLARRGSG